VDDVEGWEGWAKSSKQADDEANAKWFKLSWQHDETSTDGSLQDSSSEEADEEDMQGLELRLGLLKIFDQANDCQAEALKRETLLLALGEHTRLQSATAKLTEHLGALQEELVERARYDELTRTVMEELAARNPFAASTPRTRSRSDSKDRLGLGPLSGFSPPDGTTNNANDMVAQALQDVNGIFVAEGAIKTAAIPVHPGGHSPSSPKGRSPEGYHAISPKSRRAADSAISVDDTYEKREIELGVKLSSSPEMEQAVEDRFLC